MKKYVALFFNEKTGAETMEFVALIVVAAVLIGVVASIAGDVVNTMDDSWSGTKSSLEQSIQKIDDSLD